MTDDLQDKRGQCKAAPARWPYREHRTMREVLLAEFMRRDYSTERYMTFDQWCNRG